MKLNIFLHVPKHRTPRDLRDAQRWATNESGAVFVDYPIFGQSETGWEPRDETKDEILQWAEKYPMSYGMAKTKENYDIEI